MPANIKGGTVQGHKYIKRTGYPGNYVYWYKYPDGSIRPGDDNQQRQGKREHAHRLLAGKGVHHDMDHSAIAKETGADESHIRALADNMKAHKQQGRAGHEFDDKEVKAAAGDTIESRKEKLQAELEKRKAKQVDTDTKMKTLEESLNNVKTQLRSKPEPMKEETKEPQKPQIDRGITPELQEKIKRLGKGEGRKVDLEKHELEILLDQGIFALISAGRNPAIQEDKNLDDEKIQERYKNLENDLVEGGYAYSPVKGHYDGEEDSFLVMVHEADRNHMRMLGHQYNQDSIIYAEGGKQEMYFTTGDNDGTMHIGEKWQNLPEATDYFTEFTHPDGSVTKFSLNFNFDEAHRDQRDEGTWADGDRPKNNLGPPPPENEAFIKEGAGLDEETVQKFIENFEPDFKALTVMNKDLKEAGATHFASRLKDKQSLTAKMNGKLAKRSLNTVTDVIGARGLANTLEDQQKMLSAIQDRYDIVELEDFSDNARPDGYRAVHLLFRTPTGKIGELQLKTHRQQIYSGFTHDSIYKGKDEVKNNPEVKKYTKELSDYLYNLDKGGQDNPESRPKEPKILTDNGIAFDWSKINETDPDKYDTNKSIADLDLFKAAKKKGLKYFTALRHKSNKETMHVEEHDTFEEAKKFRDKMVQMGHKGESPIGYASSREEYLKTFSEYEPKEQEQGDDKKQKKTGPGSRGGVIIGFDKSGRPIYQSSKNKLKKSFSLVISKDEPIFKSEDEVEPIDLRKSVEPMGKLTVRERIALIKGIIHGRKEVSRLQK